LKGFAGKVAIVTGASTGIGAETARLLAAQGAKLVCASRSPDTLEQLVSEIEAEGGEAIAVPTDVAVEADVIRMVEAATSAFGRLDYAVNNAGYSPPGSIVDMTMEEFDKTSETNFRGVFQCMKYEIPEMLKVGGGAIVNVASGSAHRGTPGLAAYGASKHAILGLSKSAALEYAPQQVRVNVVSPGAVRTVMFNKYMDTPERLQHVAAVTPLGRIGEPADVAHAIIFLLSDESAWTTGAVLNVDGGMTAGFAARKVDG